MEIPERDFLRAGYFWMGLGLLSAIPGIGPSWIGTLARLLIVLSAIVHAGEALYAQVLAARIGADIMLWFRRTMVMGYLALRVLRRAQLPPPTRSTVPQP